jgi:hypothetical protein
MPSACLSPAVFSVSAAVKVWTPGSTDSRSEKAINSLLSRKEEAEAAGLGLYQGRRRTVDVFQLTNYDEIHVEARFNCQSSCVIPEMANG